MNGGIKYCFPLTFSSLTMQMLTLGYRGKFPAMEEMGPIPPVGYGDGSF
jgi:hypothetical protein